MVAGAFACGVSGRRGREGGREEEWNRDTAAAAAAVEGTTTDPYCTGWIYGCGWMGRVQDVCAGGWDGFRMYGGGGV